MRSPRHPAAVETGRSELRGERVGFVFQACTLIPSLRVEDDITLPLRLAGRRPDRDWIRTPTERVGPADRLHHRPAELSGDVVRDDRTADEESPGGAAGRSRSG